jgi:regulator of replication initiation timing
MKKEEIESLFKKYKVRIPKEIDFEVVSAKAKLQAEKDINNTLHKTIDKLRINLYETQQENQQLKDNWNKLKEWLEEETIQHWSTTILDKMQELEKGNNNEL